MRFNIHHIHLRKRHTEAKKKKQKNVKLAPYPHPNEWVRLLDRTMVFIAIIGPLFNLPQILKIYLDQQVAGLAITTWVMLLIMKFPWMLYAVVHKQTPLLVTSVLWALSHITIIVGIIIYG